MQNVKYRNNEREILEIAGVILIFSTLRFKKMPRAFYLFNNECSITHESLAVCFFKVFFPNRYCIVDQKYIHIAEILHKG